MKRATLGIIAGIVLGFSSVAFGQSDITEGVNETRADVTKWRLDTVKFLVSTSTCKVTYNKLDASDIPTGLQKVIVFQDITDDPDTPGDETSTDFTDLIVFINAGSNIKNRITTAVKTKLGLP